MRGFLKLTGVLLVVVVISVAAFDSGLPRPPHLGRTPVSSRVTAENPNVCHTAGNSGPAPGITASQAGSGWAIGNCYRGRWYVKALLPNGSSWTKPFYFPSVNVGVWGGLDVANVLWVRSPFASNPDVLVTCCDINGFTAYVLLAERGDQLVPVRFPGSKQATDSPLFWWVGGHAFYGYGLACHVGAEGRVLIDTYFVNWVGPSVGTVQDTTYELVSPSVARLTSSRTWRMPYRQAGDFEQAFC